MLCYVMLLSRLWSVLVLFSPCLVHGCVRNGILAYCLLRTAQYTVYTAYYFLRIVCETVYNKQQMFQSSMLNCHMTNTNINSAQL